MLPNVLRCGAEYLCAILKKRNFNDKIFHTKHQLLHSSWIVFMRLRLDLHKMFIAHNSKHEEQTHIEGGMDSNVG